MNRRDFLKTTAAAGLVLAGGFSGAGCAGIKREDLEKQPENPAPIAGLDATGRSILYHASLAPNGHNVQGWTIDIPEKNHWILGTDPQRWLAATDETNMTLMLSLGAFIENLVLAAGHYGFHTDISITARDAMDPRIARIRLEKGSGTGPPCNYPIERLTTRRMVKLPYEKRPLKPADVSFLTTHAPDHIAYFPKGSSGSGYLEEAMMACNRIQVFRRDYREELAQWLRFTDRDGLKFRDGLTPEAMSIQGITGWMVRHVYNRDSIFTDGFHDKYLDILATLLECHGGWFVFSGKDASVAGLIRTGRRLERLWLKARERGIGIQPYSQMIEEAPGVASALWGNGRQVHFIMRAGYIHDYPDPVSLRRPVEWFVTPPHSMP